MLGLLGLFPLHHGGEAPEDANAFQRFNDSDLGVFTGSVLHSTGALLFAAGIIAYLVVARSLKRHGQGRGPWLSVLPYAHWFTISGIVLNGAGGLMRLYQTDHPGLAEFGSSLWVQVLVAKHLFLVVGVGLAVWVTFKTQAPEPEEEPLPQLGMTPNRIASFSVLSFATIMLATLLGAVAAQAPLPGMEADQGGAAPGGPVDGVLVRESFVTYGSGGTITATPLAPVSQDALTFYVIDATNQVVVDLSWSGAQSVLAISLRHEDGKDVVSERKDLGARSIQLIVEAGNVRAGNWTAVVSSSQAVNENYNVKSRLRLGESIDELLEGTITMTPTSRFFEINLQLDLNRTMVYDWRVEGSTSLEVYFNVHTHRGGQVQTPVEGHYNRYNGTWTQDDASDSGVSLLWEPEDAAGVKHAQDVRLSYRVQGPFRVDSIYGP